MFNEFLKRFGKKSGIKFKRSFLADKYLQGLRGAEIGGSAHNPFGLDTINVDYTADIDTVFKKEEVKLAGEYLKVDVEASGDHLPFRDESLDFIISSHVLEHFWDPIKALKEWMRVVKKSGYVFMIIPHKERTFDKDRLRTSLKELLDRHNGNIKAPEFDLHSHYSVWITEDLLELCSYMNLNVIEFQDVDDKVGNGFTIVIRK
ncbi:MAG: class I SAM-dependent methyltransferase [Smithella sp.]